LGILLLVGGKVHGESWWEDGERYCWWMADGERYFIVIGEREAVVKMEGGIIEEEEASFVVGGRRKRTV
jgi:hypothetical protein